MRAMRLRLRLAAMVVLLLLATGANAGQRRVNVGFGGNNFAPGTVTLNLGDHVTWVWVGGGHTVTNGFDRDPIIDPNQGQIFDSQFLNGANQAFSWQSDAPGNIPYYCDPHFPGMTGMLQISASGVAVSSFRITEVQYNEASGFDRIEIANLGGDFGDLGRYRIAISGTTAIAVPLGSVGVLSGGSPGRVVIHTNRTGTNTQTEQFMPGIGNLPATGSVALYAPNTAAGMTSLADSTQIIDFVQWGAGDQPNAATAVAAGIWPSTGDFVPAVPVVGDYDIAFCGAESQTGSGFWDVAHPNFRAQAPCATPTRATTWGRIKVLYR